MHVERSTIFAIVVPVLLGGVLVCGIAAIIFAVAVTPSGINPIEGVGLWLYLQGHRDELKRPAGEDITMQRFEIQAGENANQIGVNLVTQGIIDNGTLFARYARYQGLDDDLKPGVFFLNETMTIQDVLDILTNPIPTTVRFLVRENMRLEEIAVLVDNTMLLNFSGQEFINVVGPGAQIPDDFRQRYGIPIGASLEGFLYPATYELDAGTTAVGLRDKMLEAFTRAIPQEMLDEATRQGRSIFQVATLASIVEREAVHADERPMIASVYLNRLSIGQKLDADPTVQYQVANNRQDEVWWPRITQADYTGAVGPYNTYLNTGLPPGPIVSPSLSSIRAVLYPAQTNYLYFRATCSGDGYHQFSVTFEEHLSKGC